MKRTGQLTRRTPLARTGKLRPMSSKRQREARIYSQKRKAFLAAHPWCQWWIATQNVSEEQVRFAGGWAPDYPARERGAGIVNMRVPLSCDIHHKAGRTGKNFLDESTWAAVSRESHEYLHAHPKEARAKGWLL